MFNRISSRYDFLNRLLSLRRDVVWRKKIAALLPPGKPLDVLDMATGTADVLLALCRMSDRIRFAVGIDMAQQMLTRALEKIRRAGRSQQVSVLPADALRPPFREGVFDAVTMAFGIRNVTDVDLCLREMRRVLRPGGRALILEFSLPANHWIRTLYLLYFRHILPRIGGLISGDAEAYGYLNRSVETFPYGRDFEERMEKAGFGRVKTQPLTFGIASIYMGEKLKDKE